MAREKSFTAREQFGMLAYEPDAKETVLVAVPKPVAHAVAYHGAANRPQERAPEGQRADTDECAGPQHHDGTRDDQPDERQRLGTGDRCYQQSGDVGMQPRPADQAQNQIRHMASMVSSGKKRNTDRISLHVNRTPCG